MWVEISEDTFRNSDFKGLYYLVHILSWFPGSFPRYNIFIDYEKVKNTDNFKKIAGIDSEFGDYINHQFDEFITSSSSTFSPAFKISNDSKGKNIFNIEESIRFFNQPLYILIENSKNDANFLRALFLHFDYSNKLVEFVNNGWIRFDNAGGCTNVKNVMVGEMKSFESLAAKFNRELWDYYRAFILLDSDREYYAQGVKDSYRDLITYFTSINFTSNNYHVLEKRTMENYMPDEVFLDLKSSAEILKDGKLLKWIEAYLSLSDMQKDFLSINNGFSGKDYDSLSEEVKKLYLDLKESKNFNYLNYGFKIQSFKSKFAEHFVNNPRVNRQTLAARGGDREYEKILEKIFSLI
jgi:hypothetical protein